MGYVVTDSVGRVVRVGDAITSFRGDVYTFGGVTRGPEYNGTAKVSAGGREFYAQVFDLTVVAAG